MGNTASHILPDPIWLKHYPKGVPATIDWTQYRSIAQLIEESLRKYAARPAYECMGKTDRKSTRLNSSHVD